MSTESLERRCLDVLERYVALYQETERIRTRFNSLQHSSRALKADMDLVLVKARAERRRGAAVRHAGSQIMAQCSNNLKTANSLLRAQHDPEEDLRRREVDRTIERVIQVFAAQGMFAFRWDTDGDLPIISLRLNAHHATARVQ